jgi:hypothetical protein
MWIVFWFTAAEIWLAYGLLEYFYGSSSGYYCWFTPYEDGSGQVTCQYIP